MKTNNGAPTPNLRGRRSSVNQANDLSCLERGLTGDHLIAASRVRASFAATIALSRASAAFAFGDSPD